MKNVIKILSIVALLFAGNIYAQDSLQVQNRKMNKFRNNSQSMNQSKAGFIDLNGDGFNDNAPDADGDGIPNGQDADYTGSKNRKGNGSRGFVDLDGDGINDNALDSDGDGIPNGQDPDFVRPMDGTGNGNGQGNGLGQRNGNGNGSGNCNGNGETKGKRGGRNR